MKKHKEISMLDLRRNSLGFVKRLRNSKEAMTLTYRGVDIALITPINKEEEINLQEDPFYNISSIAVEAGGLTNDEIDKLIYE